MNIQTMIETTRKKTLSSTVVCFDGISHPRSNCKKIDGKYYLIGNINVRDSGHGYEIPDWTTEGVTTFVRSTNQQLIWDYSRKTYCKRSLHHQQVVVDKTSNAYIMEWVHADHEPFALVLCLDGSRKYFIKSLIDTNTYYDPITNMPVEGKFVKASMINNLRKKPSFKPRYNSFNADTYNFADLSSNVMSTITHYSEKFKETLSERSLEEFLGNKTFGFEFETCSGGISEFDCFDYGLIPVRDGSITGHEYVSTVKTNKKLLHWIDVVCEKLSGYALTNEYCSLHIHVGNLPTTKEFTVSVYSLYERLSKEIDYLNPPYKRNLTYLATKREAKDHCKPLPKLFKKGRTIDEVFADIITLFNDNVPVQINSDKKLFTHVHEGRPKWEHHGRYHELNFIPFWFESKRTLEFRVPAGTLNKHNVAMWLFLANGIIEYAKKHSDVIFSNTIKITLEDVIDAIYGERKDLQQWLKNIVNEKTQNCRNCILQNDLFGDHFTQDWSYAPKGLNLFQIP